MDTAEEIKQSTKFDIEESSSEFESARNVATGRPKASSESSSSSSSSSTSAEEERESDNETMDSNIVPKSPDSVSASTEEEILTESSIATAESDALVKDNITIKTNNETTEPAAQFNVAPKETETSPTQSRVDNQTSEVSQAMEVIESSECEQNESDSESNNSLQGKPGGHVAKSNNDDLKADKDESRGSEFAVEEATQSSVAQCANDKKNQDAEAMEVVESESNSGSNTVDEISKDHKEAVESEINLNVDQSARALETMEVVESESDIDEIDEPHVQCSTEKSDEGSDKSNAEVGNVDIAQAKSVEAMETEAQNENISSPVQDDNKSDTVLEETSSRDVELVETDTSQSQDGNPVESVQVTDENNQGGNVCTNEDPIEISGENDENQENGESILPDTEKFETVGAKDGRDVIDADFEPQYIVTNNNEKFSSSCMQCGKVNVPKYTCEFEGNTLYVCSDSCLDDLKEKKPSKVVVRGLRVKMFASEDQTRRSGAPAAAIASTQSADVDYFLQRCKECTKAVDVGNYFSWNTYNYCNDVCLAIFQKISGVRCIECNTDVPESLLGKYSVRFGQDMKQFCKNSCLLDHKKGQKFCSLCQAQIEKDYHGFCSEKCFEVHNAMSRRKTGKCAVCLKEKMMEIEFEDDVKLNTFCGEPCFVAYKFVNNVQPLACEFCNTFRPKLNMKCSFSFGSILHNLCSKDCQKLFIITNRKIVHCLWCNVKKYNFDMIQIVHNNSQYIVCSLNCYNLHQMSLTTVNWRACNYCHKDVKPLFHLTSLDGKVHNFCSVQCLNLYKEKCVDDTQSSQNTATEENQVNGGGNEIPTETTKNPVKKIVVVKPRPIPEQRNISTMCKPYQITKSINCRPREAQKGCQTEEFSNKFFLPIPVPIYVPTPAHMYVQPVPMPLPFPLPIPVPIFIPTTRKSANGIMKEIHKIKNKVPADPLEAELLMMAEMVAGDKKDETDSESEDDTTVKDFPPEPLDTNNSFGEDVLQMALKMASDFEEPVDLEGAVSATTISAQAGQEDSAQRIESIMETKRRSIRQARQGRKKQQPNAAAEDFQPTSAVQPPVELEKPDANMCLKYTFGVNAWKQWVTTKNLELQKTSKRVKLFKTEILQLTADELNFSLCLFVKEVRKPNGTEYAPDTIYYLCLGIQQYLYENGRIDNIFCDTFYEKFTDCLNEVCRKFSLLYNESQYIVTRVEEEHLWESKQLGAHSPLVLLNTLMFFNTKHFSLTTVDEHLQLSFSHIMKHWKRNPNQPGARNVLLRFYPPQTSDGPRKKKVYEQQENEDNPLRCPVKLYEFYLSKCPESVKTRNDVFYLQPERSCVPDSPVWYSTMALGKEPLEKMLNRVKMVKEINVALLTT